jgi:hypothetical protein
MITTRLLVKQPFPFVTFFGAIFYCFSFFPSSGDASERLFSLQIGPTWPTATTLAWDGEVMFGNFIDKKVGFGIAADFLWHTRTLEKDTADQNGSPSKITLKDESSYMFPVMGFFVFDPIPEQMIHPMVKFEIGYNSLIYNFTMRNPPAIIPRTGYHYGLIIKAGIDGLYNVGGQAAACVGLDYRWAETKSTKDSNGFFSRRDMSGAGIHIGFRFLL